MGDESLRGDSPMLLTKNGKVLILSRQNLPRLLFRYLDQAGLGWL